MDIFESLENLPISETCFNDIIRLAEEFINEVSDKWKQDCKDKAASTKAHYSKKYDWAKSAYDKEPSSKNGDYVLDACVPLDDAEKREEKLLKAIAKHDKAKAEGRIKPAKKEDEDDSNK